MNKKQKILSLSGILVIIIIITLYLVFSEKTICKDINIEIINTEKEQLINEEHIKKIVLNKYKDLIGDNINSVNLSDLEKLIEKHPSVKNAEVYKTINGILAIKIEQKTPIVRIMPIYGNNFYIDKEGTFMPVSNKGSARVIVANGNIGFDYKNTALTINDTIVTERLRDIYKLAKEISDDDFLKAQIEQIFVKPNEDYELIPKVGNHIVVLGDIYNYKNKLKYLKNFYLKTLNNKVWGIYKEINLKYKNQIVCVRKN